MGHGGAYWEEGGPALSPPSDLHQARHCWSQACPGKSLNSGGIQVAHRLQHSSPMVSLSFLSLFAGGRLSSHCTRTQTAKGSHSRRRPLMLSASTSCPEKFRGQTEAYHTQPEGLDSDITPHLCAVGGIFVHELSSKSFGHTDGCQACGTGK